MKTQSRSFNSKWMTFTEGVGSTKVLLQAWLDVVIFGCSSLSAVVPADGILLGFLFLSCTLVFQSASVPGLDEQ